MIEAISKGAIPVALVLAGMWWFSQKLIVENKRWAHIVMLSIFAITAIVILITLSALVGGWRPAS